VIKQNVNNDKTRLPKVILKQAVSLLLVADTRIATAQNNLTVYVMCSICKLQWTADRRDVASFTLALRC